MPRSVLTAFLFSLVALAPAASASTELAPAEVTFEGAGGFQLNGTLIGRTASADAPGAPPAGAPALLLLPGSGPTDRNGNQPPMFVTDLLKQIAEHLAADGIATLRFDKRAAHVYADAWPRDHTEFGAFFSYENFIADATAAYRFLRAREGIDPSRIAILGHSEGGLFALQIADDLAAGNERPAGLILAGTAGRVLDDVLREQIRAMLEKQTPDQSVRDSYLAHLERGIAAIEKKEPIPADIPAGLMPLFNPSAQQLLHAYFTVDPALLAAGVRGPVLIIQGQRDTQISHERDAPRLEEALRKRAGAAGAKVETAIVPDASHNLKQVQNDAELGFFGPVVPDALDRIAEWCRKHLSDAPR